MTGRTVTPIKLRIVERGLRQREVAHQCGILDSRLSNIALGHAQPRPDEVERLARLLGPDVFPPNEAA